ncbi:winged helix-turn-helix transcriptional regulator [Salinarimonas soli]|uniref:Helix-turn-helix transcriptional regulator n=1 Tax=Salinarimonas soli TaxID=1638099 RepID=A0A5B2VYF0_9HYPH|nr:helix-turn-helix domain-containing protein [Salinarimonas soli]KAA2244065.1 helix-turn-helix transcriptional regulator [Salinarimonas soli]
MNDLASRRRYDDACGTAHALDLVGERWALLVARELMLGPKRFSDLRAGLPGISANVLTQRLEGLEAAGVLTRRRLPPPASVGVYELTSWGYELEPVILSLGRWAARSPGHDPTLPLSAASLMFSFKAMFDPGALGDAGIVAGFRLGSEEFCVRVANGTAEPARQPAAEGDFILESSAEAIAAVVYGGVPMAKFEAVGALSLAGDRALAERFVGLFKLPAKAVVDKT